MRRLRKHLSFANVLSVVAVFLALGGAAYAGTKISGKSITNGTIAKKKLKKNVLVPVCPTTAPSRVGDLCYGPVTGTGGGDWDTAMRACQSVGLRVPSPGEAMQVTKVASSDYIWTDDISDTGPPSTRTIIRTAEPIIAVIAKTNSAIEYRCVIGATTG